jgi:hypothetical protein
MEESTCVPVHINRVLSPYACLGLGLMSESIDDRLAAAFTSERVIRAFFNYKLAKWDRFTGFENPDINIPMGADGVAFEAFQVSHP